MAETLIVNLPLAVGIDGSEWVPVDQSDGAGGFVTRRTTTEAISDLAGLQVTGVVPGTYGNANAISQFTVDIHGRITAAANISPTVLSGTVSSVALSAPAEFVVGGSPITVAGTLTFDWATPPTGTGAAVFDTSPTIQSPTIIAPTLVTPDLGTPSAANLTNATNLPVASGISGLGTGVATFLATPSSANLAAAVSDETGSGALVFGTAPALTNPTIANPVAITGVPTPTNAGDAVNKAYADALASGLSIRASCDVSTTTALAANTYANGTLGVGATLTGNANGSISPIDGHATLMGDRVLVKNEATQSHNGIYTVTQIGDGSHPYILTRAADYDTSAEVTSGSFTFVVNGTTNGETQWGQVTDNPITIGTTAIVFTQISVGAISYTAGSGLSLSAGGAFSISAPVSVANGGWNSTTVAGGRLNFTLPVYVADRTALKALDTTKDKIAYLLESGRAGAFVWQSGNYASSVTADTQEGIYIKANAIATSSGAWVRDYNVGVIDALWFGAVADYVPGTGTGTDNSTALSAAINMAIFLKCRVLMPPGNMRVASRIVLSYATDVIFEMVGSVKLATAIYIRGAENTGGFLKITMTNISGTADMRFSDFIGWAQGDGGANMACGTFIELVRTPVPGLRVQTEVEMVRVCTQVYNNDTGYFNNGTIINGYRFPTLDYCRFENPNGPTVSGAPDAYDNTWLAYKGAVGVYLINCYGCLISYCHVQAFSTGYLLNTTTGEGGNFLQSVADVVKVGIYKVNLDDEPGFIVEGCHMNYRDYGIQLATGKLGIFSDTLFYNQNTGTDGVAVPADFYFQTFSNGYTIVNCIGHFDAANAAARCFILTDVASTGRAIAASGNYGDATYAAVFKSTAADVKFVGDGNEFPLATVYCSNNGVVEIMNRRLPVSGGFVPGWQGTPTSATNKSASQFASVVENNGDVKYQLLGGTTSRKGLVFGDSAQITRAELYQFSNANNVRLDILGVETFRWDVSGAFNIASGTAKSVQIAGATVIDNSAGLRFPAYTAATIAAKASSVNTADKATGKAIWDSNNHRIMVASGSADVSAWWIADGSASVTPV